MGEIVIIISDLYLADSDPGDTSRSSFAAAAPALRGLKDVVRFGEKSALERGGGWRAWLARRMGSEELAQAAPAAIVAATSEAAATVDAASSRVDAVTDSAPPIPPVIGTVWIATPVHLLAGLTRLHLDYRSLLRLSPAELTDLARDFATTFGDSGFHLAPSPSGALLLRSRAPVDATTTEPARALANELGAALPSGPDARVLKSLGAEMEMWLHSHPLNEARARRGELPVSTLWLWGGGPQLRSPSTSVSQPTSLAVFGSDPYLIGLGHLGGTPVHPLPERLPDLTPSPDIQSVALIAELIPLLQANPHWTMFEALVDVDRRFIEPAIAALRRGTVDTVVLVANDARLQVRRRDLLKFWRRRPKSVSAALHALCW